MRWNYKRILGLGFPLFIFAISFYVYYVVVYTVLTQFYAANGMTWLSVILGVFFHIFFAMFLWTYIMCTFSDAGPVPVRLRQPKSIVEVGGSMRYCDRCQAFNRIAAIIAAREVSFFHLVNSGKFTQTFAGAGVCVEDGSSLYIPFRL